jgi:hypothetical protein
MTAAVLPASAPRAQPDELAAPALRAYFRIAEQWKLSTQEARRLLGDPPSSTFFQWKKSQSGNVGRDTIERISYVLGIFKALEILFSDPAQADGWVRRPNEAPLFGGKAALDRMLSGNVADLYVVREYLDAQRGWG